MPTAPRVHQIHVLEFPLVDVVTVAVAVEFVEDVQFIEQLMVPFNVGDITGEVVFNDGDITGEVVFNDGDITGEVVFNDGDITGEVVFNDGDITGEVVFIDGDIAGEMEATGGVPHAAAAHILNYLVNTKYYTKETKQLTGKNIRKCHLQKQK